MTTYCGSFLLNLATFTKHLRDLIKQDTQWIWSSTHQQAFTKIKEMLAFADVYFRPNSETQIIADASLYGLEAVIAQK